MKSIISIISEILEIEENDIRPEMEFKNLQNWDSLIHIQIVAEVEEEYKISLPIERLGEINTVAALIKEADARV